MPKWSGSSAINCCKYFAPIDERVAHRPQYGVVWFSVQNALHACLNRATRLRIEPEIAQPVDARVAQRHEGEMDRVDALEPVRSDDADPHRHVTTLRRA